MAKKRTYYIASLSCLITIYVTLMVVFTFYDYQITSFLYKPGNAFGKFFEAMGPMFMPIFMIFSTVGLVMFLKFKRNVSKVFTYIGLGFCYTYAAFMGVMTHKHSYAPYMFVPSIVFYILFTTFVIFLNLKIKKDKPQIVDKYIKYLFIIFITASVSLIGVDIIKCIFGRVRFLNIASESEFRYWFCFNKFEFNSSFPSGHASRAITTICFSLIPLFFGKKILSIAIEIIGALFAITVSISRLFEGMHYPTDLITGLFVTYIAYFVSKYHFLLKS